MVLLIIWIHLKGIQAQNKSNRIRTKVQSLANKHRTPQLKRMGNKLAFPMAMPIQSATAVETTQMRMTIMIRVDPIGLNLVKTMWIVQGTCKENKAMINLKQSKKSSSCLLYQWICLRQKPQWLFPVCLQLGSRLWFSWNIPMAPLSICTSSWWLKLRKCMM